MEMENNFAERDSESHIITACKRIWGKVIFSEACVKNSVHRRGVPGLGVWSGTGGAWSRGCLVGGSDPRGCLIQGGLVLGCA